jgi:hypothetical protein
MKIACLLVRRGLPARIEGELPPDRARRLDGHLARCGPCRELFGRVRAGHEAGRRFGRLRPGPPARLPAFEEIGAERAARSSVRPMAPSPAVRAVLAVAAAGIGLFVLFEWLGVLGPAGRGFSPLAIGDFATNTRNKIVTEGFVHNVYFDAEERTLHIKLVEGPRATEPFVICEVRDPRGLTIPEQGNRVRVYGTARFDSQPGRNWHEVNPVSGIAVLTR